MSAIPDKDGGSYWAAQPDSQRAAANVVERIKRYRDWLKDTGRAGRMRRGFNTMYGRAPDGTGDTSQTGSSGDQGEYVDVTLNKYATLVTQSVVRTTAEKPAFKAIPTNSDSKSMEQAAFGQGLLEYYSNTHSVADRDWEMVEVGEICSEGWEIWGWDSTAGKNLTDFSDEPSVNAGDIEVHVATPFRVAYDPDAESIDRLKWIAFKRRYNRFDLAAGLKERNPEAAQKLKDMTGDTGIAREWDSGEDDLDLGGDSGTSGASADLVWVWEFRHLPTAALPRGRLLRFVNGDCVIYDSMILQPDGTLQDEGYPYDDEELHAHRYCPANVVGSIAGHAPSFDLLGLQELKDTVATMAATAANAGGITNMWTRTSPPTLSSVIGAMNFLTGGEKPEILKGVELSDQIPVFDALLDENMQSRMGESDVSMGDVPKGMPGNLAALLEAKTVQYKSRAQASYAHVLERSRTGMLKLLQRFAKSERVAVLGGVARGYEHRQWTAEDLTGVDRFVVESVNPLSQTYAGRCDAAKELLEHGLIDDPKQYLLMRETGRLEPMLESELSMLMGVRKEKEMLLRGVGLPPLDPAASFAATDAAGGKPAPMFADDGQPHIRPLIYDVHWHHILEDLGTIASPEARADGRIVEAVMGVVEERLRLMKLIDPVMLAVMKCPPEISQAIMMAANPMMGMPMPDGSQPPGPPGSGKSPKSPEQGGLPAGAPRITAAKPAKPPRNPLTGEQSESPVDQ